MFELFAAVKRLTDAGTQLRSLAKPWVDTTTSIGRLLRGKDRRSAHVLAAYFGAAAAFRCTSADQVALYVCRPAQDGNHQPAEARQRRAEGSTLKKLASSYNTGRATILKSIRNIRVNA